MQDMSFVMWTAQWSRTDSPTMSVILSIWIIAPVQITELWDDMVAEAHQHELFHLPGREPGTVREAFAGGSPQRLLNSCKHTQSQIYDFLLKGLIFCHECGYLMVVLNQKMRSGKGTCSLFAKLTSGSPRRAFVPVISIKEEAVNEAVITKTQEVCQTYLNPGRLRPIAKEAVENINKANRCEAEMQAPQSIITDLTTIPNHMYMGRLSGLLLKEDFQRIYQKVKIESWLKSFQEQAKQLRNTKKSQGASKTVPGYGADQPGTVG